MPVNNHVTAFRPHGDSTKIPDNEKLSLCQFAIAHAEEYRTKRKCDFNDMLGEFCRRELGRHVSRPGDVLVRVVKQVEQREKYLLKSIGVAIPDSDLLQAGASWRNIVKDVEKIEEAWQDEVNKKRRANDESANERLKRQNTNDELSRLAQTMLRSEELKVQRQQVELDSARTQRIQEASLEERMGTLESRIDEKLVQMGEMMEKTLSSVETPAAAKTDTSRASSACLVCFSASLNSCKPVSTAQSPCSSDADEPIRLAPASSLHVWKLKQMEHDLKLKKRQID
ncbi:hypothetical protein AAP_02455 [Ascosphaera apis ARSEF 7405]|uniref:Uncharacterized protein n=1 Tax=Ascosphaera apis ARSEF 7405 TaxID=392613 RepID=A0A162IHU6_9EURO|nr:hypothetical protein AAP_02455 [Ascosphaera apis ARSEF 7405]